MASMTEIVRAARALLRDFPEFFQASFRSENLRATYELPQPNVLGDSLVVRADGVGDLDRGDDWLLDERQGLLRFTENFDGEALLYVEGYHYKWFSDSDLALAANFTIADHKYGRNDFDLDWITDSEATTIATGTVVQALWSLLSELALDIDIAGPEGVMVPVRQRFEQVMTLIQYWSSRYEERSRVLGIGLERIESFTLRRISLTTGRLVPLYIDREIDDRSPPTRVFNPIDTGVLPLSTHPLVPAASSTGTGLSGHTIEVPLSTQNGFVIGPYVGEPPASIAPAIADPSAADEAAEKEFWDEISTPQALPEWK